MSNSKNPPSFGAKFKKTLAIEFLTISTISLFAIVIFIFQDIELYPYAIFEIAAILYGVIIFIKLVIGSIKIIRDS